MPERPQHGRTRRPKVSTAAITLVVTCLCFGPAADVGLGEATGERSPNIVFILADDLGWAELGCYGNRFHDTPHLDQLAKRGMRFTQAYAAAPVCSPYRAALLTGQHPARIGILDYLRPNSANGLSTTHATLPEQLRHNGYLTGLLGKWHLSGYAFHDAEFESMPKAHGFDWEFGREVKSVGNGANFWPYVFRQQPIRWLDIPDNRLGDQEYLTDRLNREAVEFIERHRDRPFFLYLSHYAPHTILNGRPDLVKKYIGKHPPGESGRDRCYLCEDAGLGRGDPGHHWAASHNPHLAAMLESIDHGVGMISDKLQELGLADNTIVIFTSDNGGETNVTSNAPLRGGKSQLYEGGIRVPLIVRWPKQIPPGTVCRQPTMNIDLYPTLLDAAGIESKSRMPVSANDGVSTLETWQDPAEHLDRDGLYWHYPLDRPHFLGGVSAGAVREGDWKLIEFFDDNRTELYQLSIDPSEQHDVFAQHPAVAARLKKRLKQWRISVDARSPSPPQLAEPRQLYFADHFSSDRASERWFFNGDWTVRNEMLQRPTAGAGSTRIFLKKPEYKDVVIRFDFQLQQSQDIRLVTGSSGHYNAVVHIRPDHFFVQTAMDESGPYFSYRHGECSYDFDPQQWHTMTVEIIGDELVAHVDREHLAYAKHPILDKQRTYFAFQVDGRPAAFDNVQIFRAAKHRDQTKNRAHITSISGAHPVEKPLTEQLEIQKRNAHEWLYQRRKAYRDLVHRVDELDEQKKQLFPDVFRTHKEFRQRIAEQRKKLLKESPAYKETLFATYRAERGITDWLVAQQPSIAELPDSNRKHAIERLRQRHGQDSEYQRLSAVRDAAQKKLETDYPQLFITDAEIIQSRNKRRELVKDDPTFKRLIEARAAAYRAQQAYLVANDRELAALERRSKQRTSKEGK